jgi:hypothetical protein
LRFLKGGVFQTDAAAAPSHVGGKVKPRADHRTPSSTGTPTDASVDEQIAANMDGGWKKLETPHGAVSQGVLSLLLSRDFTRPLKHDVIPLTSAPLGLRTIVMR